MTAYDQGHSAYHEGLWLADCPYAKGTDDWTDWYAGYLDADEEYERVMDPA